MYSPNYIITCLIQDDQMPRVKRRCVEPHTDVHWLSESGVIDCTVLLGPSPQQLFSQYAQLTGVYAALRVFYHILTWKTQFRIFIRQMFHVSVN